MDPAGVTTDDGCRTLGGMQYVLAAFVVAPVAALVVGALRGRVRVRQCCPADPARDARMACAFEESAPTARR